MEKQEDNDEHYQFIRFIPAPLKLQISPDLPIHNGW
jgi:hypothetical protein